VKVRLDGVSVGKVAMMGYAGLYVGLVEENFKVH
jgi:hypothetical protein